SFGLDADLLVVAGSIRPELGHLAEDRHGAAAARALEEMRKRGAHRDRVRVPGIVDQQAAARQLRLLGAPARELDLHRLLRRLDPESLGRRQRCSRICGLVAGREAEYDLASAPAHVRATVANLRLRRAEATYVQTLGDEGL